MLTVFTLFPMLGDAVEKVAAAAASAAVADADDAEYRMFGLSWTIISHKKLQPWICASHNLFLSLSLSTRWREFCSFAVWCSRWDSRCKNFHFEFVFWFEFGSLHTLHHYNSTEIVLFFHLLSLQQ